MLKSVKPIVIGVMTVLVVFGGVQSSSAAPSSCKRVGATKVQSAKMFTCVKNKKSGKLVWKRTPTTPTTTSTTSTIAVVVPRVLVAETMLTGGTWPKAVSVTSNVVGTVYLVEGASTVDSVADITRLRSSLWMSAPIAQVATPTTVAVDVDALTNGYYRVFVANSSGVLSDVATNKVTISVTRASTATTATTPVVVTCSTTCVVGDTGPGGGIVFYVHDDADDLFACGVALTSTCKYLEAAPANWLAGGDPGITWATGPNANPGASVTSSVTPAIGSGYKNSLDIVAQTGNVAASSAAVLAREYAGGSKSDWHLPSKVELNELCKYANTQTTGNTSTVCSAGTLLPGFSAVYNYWSSSEYDASLAWYQYFGNGFQADDLKYNGNTRVRPVRAFGGTVACADGGICVVGDTGPGGGIVFYVQASNGTFPCGVALTSTCKYLEAAPAASEVVKVWATTAAFCYLDNSSVGSLDCRLNSIYSGATADQAASRTAATAIGAGMANTNQIYARITTAGGAATTAYAAGIAFDYAYNGKTDWHLPSKDELNQLYEKRATVGGFSADFYWSSSEGNAAGAWRRSFGTGYQDDNNKSGNYRVRPVRAFG